jgi:hypothetical protein
MKSWLSSEFNPIGFMELNRKAGKSLGERA